MARRKATAASGKPRAVAEPAPVPVAVVLPRVLPGSVSRELAERAVAAWHAYRVRPDHCVACVEGRVLGDAMGDLAAALLTPAAQV